MPDVLVLKRMLRHDSWSRTPPLGGLLFVVFLALYGYHAAPDVTWGDSGEFAAVAQTLGIAHPTGYPLYTLVGKLLCTIPVATPARKLNLFSALCSALTLWVLFRLILLLMDDLTESSSALPQRRKRLCALFGASLLGICPMFISQAVITEVYALSNLFQALLWYLLLRWWRGEAKALWGFFGVLGLALAHHMAILLYTPFFLLVIFLAIRTGQRDEKDLVPAFPFVLPGLLLYLYIPLRASMGPVINWGDPSSTEKVLWMLRGGDFRGNFRLDLLFLHGAGEVFGRFVADHIKRLQAQFPWVWLLGLFALGRIACRVWRGGPARRSLVLPGFLGLAVVFNVIYLSFYYVGDREVFFLSTYPITALLIGLGACFLFGWLEPLGRGRHKERLGKSIAACLWLAVAAWLLWQGLGTFQEQSARENIGAKVFGEAVMEALPPGSLLLIVADGAPSDNSIYPLWYQKWGLGRGEDVVVLASNFLTKPWIATQLRGRGVVLPDLDELKRAGLVVDDPEHGTVFYERSGMVRGVLLFLKRNAALRPLYTLSMLPEMRRYYDLQLVLEAPVIPGPEPALYRRYLPDGRLYRLEPRDSAASDAVPPEEP